MTDQLTQIIISNQSRLDAKDKEIEELKKQVEEFKKVSESSNSKEVKTPKLIRPKDAPKTAKTSYNLFKAHLTSTGAAKALKDRLAQNNPSMAPTEINKMVIKECSKLWNIEKGYSSFDDKGVPVESSKGQATILYQTLEDAAKKDKIREKSEFETYDTTESGKKFKEEKTSRSKNKGMIVKKPKVSATVEQQKTVVQQLKVADEEFSALNL